MKFKNVKEKLYFLEKLEENNNDTVLDEIKVIRRLSKDKNPEVRMFLAEQLVLFEREEIEGILYDMLFDKCRRVRLEAVDSLTIGRMPKTMEKVAAMIKNEGCLIRAYGVLTLFDVVVNAYGMNSNAIEKYNDYIAESFKTEKNPRVLMEYYLNQYRSGDGNGLQMLEELYRNAVDTKDYSLIWPLLHTFRDIKNENNFNQINAIIAYKLEDLLEVQREMAREILLQR